MKRILYITLFTGLAALFSTMPLLSSGELDDGLYARIETVKGDIVIALEFEKVPMTVANFVGLAEGTIENDARPIGKPYYDGLAIHRVAPGTLIQAGCPDGSGAGNPGYTFPDEIDMSLKHNGPGIVSMANKGRNTNGSQFFICMRPLPSLNGRHPVFGKVISGMEIVEKILPGDKIKHIKIIRKGKKAQQFKADNDTFNKMIEEFDQKR